MTNERVYLAVGEKDMDVVRRAPSVRVIEDEAEEKPASGEGGAMPENLGELLQGLAQRLESQEGDAADLKSWIEKLVDLLTRLEAGRGDAPASMGFPSLTSEERKLAATVEQLRVRADLYVLQRTRQDVDVLVMDLDSLDEQVVEATVMALTGKGQAAVAPLFTRLRHARSLRTRKTIMHLLNRLDPDVVRRLLEVLDTGLSASEARNVIEVLHDVVNLDLGDRADAWIRHPDPELRAALRGLIVARPSGRSLEILMKALDTAQDDVLVEVIQAVGQVCWRPAIPKLAALLKKRTIFIAPDKRIEAQKAACQALGRIGDMDALPVLLQAMRFNPFWTLMRAFHPEVRAAAALALSAFPTAEVRLALDAARRDGSDMVRAAARMALARIQGDIPASQALPLLEAPASDE